MYFKTIEVERNNSDQIFVSVIYAGNNSKMQEKRSNFDTFIMNHTEEPIGWLRKAEILNLFHHISQFHYDKLLH